MKGTPHTETNWWRKSPEKKFAPCHSNIFYDEKWTKTYVNRLAAERTCCNESAVVGSLFPRSTFTYDSPILSSFIMISKDFLDSWFKWNEDWTQPNPMHTSFCRPQHSYTTYSCFCISCLWVFIIYSSDIVIDVTNVEVVERRQRIFRSWPWHIPSVHKKNNMLNVLILLLPDSLARPLPSFFTAQCFCFYFTLYQFIFLLPNIIYPSTQQPATNLTTATFN